jgi:hypothetical protein
MIPASLTSLQIENGPFAQFLLNTQLSQFTQMAFQARLADIKAAVIPALQVTFDASGKLKEAFLKVRCQGDSTVGKFTGLSFLLFSVEGRIIREVTASVPIPSSTISIQELINEVPQSLQYTDSLYVHMFPRSLLASAFASFEIKTSLSPSEFSQVPVAIAESLADGLAEMGKISKSGVSFNFYLASVSTLPTPNLLAQIYGVGPEVSSTVDFLFPQLDKNQFFGLGDIVQEITQSVGAANTSSDAPSHIHTHGASSSRGVRALGGAGIDRHGPHCGLGRCGIGGGFRAAQMEENDAMPIESDVVQVDDEIRGIGIGGSCCGIQGGAGIGCHGFHCGLGRCGIGGGLREAQMNDNDVAPIESDDVQIDDESRGIGIGGSCCGIGGGAGVGCHGFHCGLGRCGIGCGF